MKATIEFDLELESENFDVYCAAPKMRSILINLLFDIRQKIKSEDNSDIGLADFRDIIYKGLEEEGILHLID